MQCTPAILENWYQRYKMRQCWQPQNILASHNHFHSKIGNVPKEWSVCSTSRNDQHCLSGCYGPCRRLFHWDYHQKSGIDVNVAVDFDFDVVVGDGVLLVLAFLQTISCKSAGLQQRSNLGDADEWFDCSLVLECNVGILGFLQQRSS